MSLFRFSLVLLVLGSTVRCFCSDKPSGWEQSNRNLEAVMEHLRSILSTSGGCARISYSTDCYTGDEQPLPFPKLTLQTPSAGTAGLSAVRELFEKDSSVRVTEDKSGMIRITIGEPVPGILDTKVSVLQFSPEERYNPGLAVLAILATKEVQAAERALGLKEPFTITDMNVIQAAPGLPHLPPSVKDVTVDQALNRIAKTFGGVALYRTCKGPNGDRLITFDYVGLSGFDRTGSHRHRN